MGLAQLPTDGGQFDLNCLVFTMGLGALPEGGLFGEDKCPRVSQWIRSAGVGTWHPIGLPGGQLSLKPQGVNPGVWVLKCRPEGGSAGHSIGWRERGLCSLKLSHPQPPCMPRHYANDREANTMAVEKPRPLLEPQTALASESPISCPSSHLRPGPVQQRAQVLARSQMTGARWSWAYCESWRHLASARGWSKESLPVQFHTFLGAQMVN